MSTTSITQAQGKGLRHQFDDLLGSVRGFAAQLYEAHGGWLAAPTHPASAGAKQRGRARMMSLADQAEQHSPNLSAELRNLASRGQA